MKNAPRVVVVQRSWECRPIARTLHSLPRTMRYLAQLHYLDSRSRVELKLLAHKVADRTWQSLQESRTITASAEFNVWSDRELVLIDFDTAGQAVSHIESAVPWLVKTIDGYLGYGVSPEFLEQETTRAEQWRQSLTLQNQEISRQKLELEARREQLQLTEAALAEQKAELDSLRAKLEGTNSEQNPKA